MHPPLAQPRAIVIEDSRTHAFVAQSLLSSAGFTVAVASSIARGNEHICTLLDPAHPAVPTVILLDLMLPHERCPMLEGIVLAAHTIEAMEQGMLHPAPIVAISAELNRQRLYEAELAGCRLVLSKPFKPEHVQQLRALVDMPLRLPLPANTEVERAARQAMRRSAAQLMQFVRTESAYKTAAPAMRWDVERVRDFLLTPVSFLNCDAWRLWIEAQGGVERVRAQLQQVPLPSDLREVLEQVLKNGDNWQRSTAQLNLSRSTYYRRLHDVCEELALMLNTWG